ncbi:hypothetical protein J5Y03_13110 [Bacillus sp. RG28]|uniref:SPOR domain-containing protein n=1 Tax=Gottfriedia endophytica TaxID=2820819 RepID=A0A940NKG7_9BACI|nr:cohesin domain-containing protein [Gottfriedia endophytica]MBP0726115.1 hypothetical protein [Gottfriedia endophytica]
MKKVIRKTIYYIATIIFFLASVTFNPLSSKASVGQENTSILIGNVEGVRGQIIDIPVTVQQQTAGISSYGMKVGFDPNALEVVSITPSHGSADETNCPDNRDGCFVSNYNNNDGWITAAWVDTLGGDHPIIGEKSLYSIKFKIKSSSLYGETPLKIINANSSDLIFTDSSNQIIETKVTDGKITVINDSSSNGSSNNGSSDNGSSNNGSSNNGSSDNGSSNNGSSDNGSSNNGGSSDNGSSNNGSSDNGSSNNGSSNNGSSNNGSSNNGSSNNGSSDNGSSNNGSSDNGSSNNGSSNNGSSNNNSSDTGSNIDGQISLPLNRTTDQNGKVTDEVNITHDLIQESVQKLKQVGGNTSRIFLPDKQDNVSVIKVNIPKNSVDTLGVNNMNLEISTESAKITIPNKSLVDSQDDLYFRIMPVRKEDEKQVIKDRALNEKIVKEVVGGKDVKVLGIPMNIETNMENHPVTITLPLPNGLQVSEKEKVDMLNHLVIYIEHHDGTKEIVKGNMIEYANGKQGIAFNINKFSTFTMLYMQNMNNNIPNKAPTADKVRVIGNTIVNTTLNGQYIYRDQNNDQQGHSIYRWYRASDAKGTDKKVILGATKSSYKLTLADQGKFISFEVEPIAKTGEIKGSRVMSAFVGPVITMNAAPIIKNAKVIGNTIENATLKAYYVYQDTEGDLKGAPIIKWYRVDPKTYVKKLISNETKSSYVLTKKDIGKSILYEITPTAKTGTKFGKTVFSLPTTVIKAAVKYSGHLKLGAIKNKSYVNKLALAIKNNYKGANVIVKKEGSIYRIYADFIDKKQAEQVGKEMKKRNLIVNYYVY